MEVATAEQMQEALQQNPSADSSYRRAGGTSCRFESARAQASEQERSALIQTLWDDDANEPCSDAMVDTKGIGQPFTLKGDADHDFGE